MKTDLAEEELMHDDWTIDKDRWAKAGALQLLLSEFIDQQSWKKVVDWLSLTNVAMDHNAATKLRHHGLVHGSSRASRSRSGGMRTTRSSGFMPVPAL
jgi:hypothetical protein